MASAICLPLHLCCARATIQLDSSAVFMPKRKRGLPPSRFLASNETSCELAVTAGLSIVHFRFRCSQSRSPRLLLPTYLFDYVRPANGRTCPSPINLQSSFDRV